MNKVLLHVYRASAVSTGCFVIVACLLLKWHPAAVITALVASLAISAPALVSVQAALWTMKRIRTTRAFLWMLLMASIPLFALVPACLLADAVPGKTWFLVVLGVGSGYIGMLAQGGSIAQLLNSFYETDEGTAMD
jgi:hypothetical protein